MNADRMVAVLLGITTIASLAFIAIYTQSAQTQAEAITLGLACTALAIALVVLERTIHPSNDEIEERSPLASKQQENDAAADALINGTTAIFSRRAWLKATLAGTLATLGLALLVPLRSLSTRSRKISDLTHTSWRRGTRLVTSDGTPVHMDDLEVGSMLTVFAEGVVGTAHTDEMANDATILLRVAPTELALPSERQTWAPSGFIAYSKVCTHAGCPVALYRAAQRELFCPCHQSTFDVLRGGKQIFGPAPRGLPQLPLALGTDGTLHAQSDYREPIGPDYWERA